MFHWVVIASGALVLIARGFTGIVPEGAMVEKAAPVHRGAGLGSGRAALFQRHSGEHRIQDGQCGACSCIPSAEREGEWTCDKWWYESLLKRS